MTNTAHMISELELFCASLSNQKVKDMMTQITEKLKELETENARLLKLAQSRGTQVITLTQERDEARAATYAEVVRAKAMVTRMEALEGAVVLLCDEIEISMPDKPQEFNGENIWDAYRKIKVLTPASGKEGADDGAS